MKRRALAILALVSLTGCAASIRTIGQHDPTVEAIRALGEILKARPALPLESTPTPAPSPTGTPQERLESQAATVFMRMENLNTVVERLGADGKAEWWVCFAHENCNRTEALEGGKL